MRALNAIHPLARSTTARARQRAAFHSTVSLATITRGHLPPRLRLCQRVFRVCSTEASCQSLQPYSSEVSTANPRGKASFRTLRSARSLYVFFRKLQASYWTQDRQLAVTLPGAPFPEPQGFKHRLVRTQSPVDGEPSYKQFIRACHEL